MIVDAHFHAWHLARGDYGWLTPELGAIYRDVEIAHWWAEAQPLGVRGGVLVQAAPTEAETDFLLRIAAAAEPVLGVVGWVDLLARDAPQRIARLARHPKLKGLRPMLQDLADTDWILQPQLDPGLHAMATHDLAFDALVQPRHLPSVHRLAQRHPGLRIVIDHGAKPDIASGRLQPWADDIARIAAHTRVRCKLSGLLTEAGSGATDPSALQPWVDHLLTTFGPERLLWGSDWPVLELAGRYDGWWRSCQEAAAGLTDEQRAGLFGGNARRFYRLDAQP